MKNRSWRSASFVPRLVGAVLFCAVGLGVLASAGISSTAGDGRQPLFAARADTSAPLSNLALVKSGKLSPRLQQLSQPAAQKASVYEQAATVGLPSSGPGSLLRTEGGKRLVVYVRVSGSVASASRAIENAGATIVNTSTRYGVVTAAVDPSRLQALGKLPEVISAREALAPMHAAACPSGPVVSEGDHQLAADSARSAFAVDGSGVTVGILSDSFNALGGALMGVSAGELPGAGNPCGSTTPVNVLQDDPFGGTDEGRAMLEVVHDLAPKASLAFATADTGIYGMAGNIRALRTAGAKVIADDVTYYDEPMFQKGPIDLAIDDVTSTGVSYFSSAGNSNVVVGGQNAGSYEAPAYRSTSCPAALNTFTAPFSYPDCHDFSPSGVDNGANYTLANGGQLVVDLQWAQPWNGVSTDLDLFLLDASSGNVLDYSIYDNGSGPGGSGEPFEIAGYQNTTGAPENVEVVIARYSGSALPRLKYVLFSGLNDVTSAQYNSSTLGDVVGPTIFGHNGGQNAITTAAVPYNDSTTPESYTSHGPVTYYFGPADGTTPASPLASPLVLSKPDIAATDCAQTSFFYGSGPPFRFCGTSEAAPHAAAVAALMLNHGSLTPAQVLARLQTTASAVPNGGTTDVGAGLINALGALDFPALSFAQSSYSVSEAGSSATIAITRSGGVSSAASVQFTTSNGTAGAGSDYTDSSQVVSFAPGETSKSVSVPIINNTIYASDKTVNLTLTNPSTGAAIGNPGAATLTIVNDDPAPVLAFAAATYKVNETGHAAVIKVKRSVNTSGAVSVSFATANGTAKAGSDYKAASQTVSFASGESSKTVSVPVIDDKKKEGNETVSLALSAPSGAVLGSPSTATLTIVDNDNGRIASARLTKKTFKRSQARKVQLRYSFSPKSTTFAYMISIKKGAKWRTVRSVKKTGSFVGKHTTTVKSLFGRKSIKVGRYRLKLTASANSRRLAFRVT